MKSLAATAILLTLMVPSDTILFEATFDETELDLTETWLVEGTGTAWVEDGRMYMKEDSNGVGLVAWIRETFPDDMTLSYDVEFSNNRCIGVFFIAATGLDGERTGDYDEYIQGDIDSYSFSFHRYWPDGRNNPGANARRNSGFHLLHQAIPDPMLDSERNYSVEIQKRGARLTATVGGELIHEVEDDGSLGAPHGAGQIGFRLRGDSSCVMKLDNVIVSTPSMQ